MLAACSIVSSVQTVEWKFTLSYFLLLCYWAVNLECKLNYCVSDIVILCVCLNWSSPNPKRFLVPTQLSKLHHMGMAKWGAVIARCRALAVAPSRSPSAAPQTLQHHWTNPLGERPRGVEVQSPAFWHRWGKLKLLRKLINFGLILRKTLGKQKVSLVGKTKPTVEETRLA